MAFHVPESSRDRTHPILGSTEESGNNGAFHVPSPEPGWMLALICSDGTDDPSLPRWEHVSIHCYTATGSLRQRTPSWKEMVFVKDLCWDNEDVVMQLHPKKSEYVNCHPHTLHLWRPLEAEIPTPPAIFVGPKETR